MTTDLATVAPGPAPPPAPRERIVRGPADAAVTLVVTGLLAWVVWRVGRFVLVSGRWEIVRVNLTNLLVGLFPREALWRPMTALAASVVALGFGAGATRPIPSGPRRRSLSPPPSALPLSPAAPPSPASSLSEPLLSATMLVPSLPSTPSLASPSSTVGGGRLRALAPAWPLVLLVAALAVLARSPEPVLALAGLSVLAIGAWSAGRRVPRRRLRLALLAALAVLGAGVAVLVAFGSPGWNRMGGLLLTLWLAIGGILLSFPAGVLLALGRRSSLPAVRVVTTAYIELMRGVPLVALLFIGQLVIGLLLPPGARRLDDVTRVLIAIVAFTAAYVAEIVRGGLQSVPTGQVDAAAALGLSPLAVQRLIVVPQALRAVIPALVGQFITLFKDTSLVTTIGLVELLGVAQAIPSQPRFLGQGQAEVLCFASFVFWVGAYSMSRASRRLEHRLGVGIR